MSLTIFIPVRRGSERVSEKNTRNFAGIEGGLLELKLNQLKNLELADEIVVSTNDKKCWEIASGFQKQMKNLKLVERPDELGKSETSLSDLIRHVAEITSAEEILWTHVTSPFCDAEKYTEAIKKYREIKISGFDSLISGRKYREFLLDKRSGELVNNLTGFAWPRTQDLADWFEINNAIFIASREDYLKGNRTGESPFLIEFDKISSLDIDNEEDFKIAEAVYERIYK
jgi:N-acylneuraminate cytidylyltransferase